MIRKLKEVTLDGNDVYFLEAITDKLVINNNYKGIIVLDGKNLEVLQMVNTFDGMIIYASYISNDSEELLLFCPDNECIVYINLHTYDFKVIHLAGRLVEVIFSPFYVWNVNRIILSSYNGDFYAVDLECNTITLIVSDFIRIRYPEFYKFRAEALQYRSIANRSDDLQFIYKKDQNDYYLKDFSTASICKVNSVANIPHEIRFEKNIIAFTCEESIIIISENAEIARIETSRENKFLKTRFLKTSLCTSIAVLSSSNLDNTKSLVSVYEIGCVLGAM